MISKAIINTLRFALMVFIFSGATFLFSAFSDKGVENNFGNNQRRITDTIPFKELRNVKWSNINSLTAANGMLIAKANNGESLIIRRSDYEKFARENSQPDKYEEIFTKVEIEPEYPGGPGAWMRYLNKTFRYPQEAQENEIQGTVVVQFIVDKEGNVSDVEAVSGPKNGELRDEACRLIKMSGKWNPAIQTFRIVKAYKRQPITFRL